MASFLSVEGARTTLVLTHGEPVWVAFRCILLGSDQKPVALSNRNYFSTHKRKQNEKHTSGVKVFFRKAAHSQVVI